MGIESGCSSNPQKCSQFCLRCETTASLPIPDSVGMKHCHQFFWHDLASRFRWDFSFSCTCQNPWEKLTSAFVIDHGIAHALNVMFNTLSLICSVLRWSKKLYCDCRFETGDCREKRKLSFPAPVDSLGKDNFLLGLCTVILKRHLIQFFNSWYSSSP